MPDQLVSWGCISVGDMLVGFGFRVGFGTTLALAPLQSAEVTRMYP